MWRRRIAIARWLALLATVAAAAACGVRYVGRIPSQVFQCAVSRQECVAERTGVNGVECATFAPASFTATTCVAPMEDAKTKCMERFCGQPEGVAYPYPEGCDAVPTVVPPEVIPEKPTCFPQALGNGTHLTRVIRTQRWRDCDLAEGGGFCAALGPNGNTVTQCFDFSKVAAVDLLQPPSERRERSVLISTLEPNHESCPLVGSQTSALKYEVAAGNIGTASAAGTSTTLAVVRGFAAAGQVCDSETCVTSVDRLQIELADRTVAGAQLTGVVVTNTSPIRLGGAPDPDSGLFSVPRGGVNLIATGKINGVDSFFVLDNKTTWHARATTASLLLQGSLDMVASDAAGRPLPVAISVSATGSPASPQVQACIGLSPIGRLFGFEDAFSWTSSNASLSLVTSPIRQGCGALGIAGQGYMPIVGGVFSTSGLATNQALSVDLFIPNNQPNQFWLGALQMYLTCPSGNVFNQYIGQVELTGKPQNQYSTLRFPLPAPTVATLARPLPDCAFSFALNVNPTGRTWILDNLRFTP